MGIAHRHTFRAKTFFLLARLRPRTPPLPSAPNIAHHIHPARNILCVLPVVCTSNRPKRDFTKLMRKLSFAKRLEVVCMQSCRRLCTNSPHAYYLPSARTCVGLGGSKTVKGGSAAMYSYSTVHVNDAEATLTLSVLIYHIIVHYFSPYQLAFSKRHGIEGEGSCRPRARRGVLMATLY